MPQRKRVLLRLDPGVYEAVARWAADDLRSVNSQIEYALRRALREAGRPVRGGQSGRPGGGAEPGGAERGEAGRGGAERGGAEPGEAEPGEATGREPAEADDRATGPGGGGDAP